MKYLVLIVLFFTMHDCQVASTELHKPIVTTELSSDEINLNWREIPNVSSASAIGVLNGSAIVASESTMWRIAADLAIELPPFHVQFQYSTSNAGVLSRKLRRQTRSPANSMLCVPASIVGDSGGSFVYSSCDHSDQIWSLNISDRFINITTLNFDDSDENISVFDRSNFDVVNGQLLIGADLNAKPRIIALRAGSFQSKLCWSGLRENGPITALKNSTMGVWAVTFDGEIVRGYCTRSRFESVGNIDLQPDETVLDIEFIDRMSGFAVSNQRLIGSVDGGKSWTTIQDIEDGTNRIFYSGGNTFVRAGTQLLYKADGKRDWNRVIGLAKGRIKSALLIGSSIYAIVDGKLFWADLPKSRRESEANALDVGL